MDREGNGTDLQRLRSRITVEGLDRAPHRAFLRAMGLDDAAIARPFIGVVSTAGEMTPCNMTLSQQAAAAKIGVTRATYVAKDVHDIDGVSVVLRALLDGGYLHGECSTVKGQTLAETVANAPQVDDHVVRATDQVLSPNGGVVVLKGNLCPDAHLGSLRKVRRGGRSGQSWRRHP